MKPFLRFLHLEDNPDDAILVQRQLTADGLPCQLVRIETRDQLEAALREPDFDLLLSDNALPGFDGFTALHLRQRLRPELPFIFVSGTIGEEAAIECLKQGATDYVLKHRLDRLPSAIRRALREVEERQVRARAEEKIRAQAELLNKAHDAIVETDLHGRITYWNKSAERIFRLEATEALERRIHGLLADDPSATLQAMRELLVQGEWAGDLRVRREGSDEIVVQSRWTLVADERGRPTSILILSTDVTEQKKLEASFLRVQRMESIGSLAGGIAHDLNNVLAPILLCVQLLRKKVGSKECEEWLGTLESSVQKGAGLVRQVLAFARGEAGDTRPVDVRTVVAEIRSMLDKTLPPETHLRTRLAREPWPVAADATQLQQVLLNLCVNARDAMPEGGQIDLTARNVLLEPTSPLPHADAHPGPWLVIEVSDRGSGVPLDLQQRIFEPFFTTKESGKGTGLGLATAQAIARNHNGFITVHSRAGKGSRFSLYLPACPAARATSRPLPSACVPEGQGEGILVVDDEAALREIARATLEAFGYQVWTAADGDQALDLLRRREEIALVLTDMVMPRTNGARLIRELRRLHPRVRVVVMTGSSPSPRAVTVPAGVRTLQKPVTAQDLLNAVRNALEAPAGPRRRLASKPRTLAEGPVDRTS